MFTHLLRGGVTLLRTHRVRGTIECWPIASTPFLRSHLQRLYILRLFCFLTGTVQVVR